MPPVDDLKPTFQNLLRPLVRLLARIGVSANMVTLAAMLGSIAYGIWIYQPFADHGPNPYPYLLLGPFLVMRTTIRSIHGMLVAESGQNARAAVYLNEMNIVVADAALYLPFLDLADSGILWVAMVGLCCLSEFVGVLGTAVGASRRHDGPFGVENRAFFFGLLGLFTAWAVFENRQELHGIVMNWALASSGLLAFVTCYRRFRNAEQEAAEKP